MCANVSIMKIEKIHTIILCCFVFLLHFENWEVFGRIDYFTITKLFGYIYFALALRDIKHFFSFSHLKIFLLPVLIFLSLLTFISFINYDSLYRNYVQVFDFTFIQCLLLFWIICNHLHNQTKIANWTLFFFIAGAITAGVLCYFGIGITMEEGRLSIFNENQNFIGNRMAISILILLSFVFENPLRWGVLRFLLLLTLPLMLPIIGLTGSRQAILGLAIGLMLFIIFIKMEKTTKIGFVVIAIVGGIILGNYLSQFDSLHQRIITSIESGDNAGRTDIWNRVIPIVYESPMIGVGTTGYAKRVIPIFGIWDNNNVRNPHNLYLEILCYSGIMGLFLFMLFLARLSIKSIQLYRKNNYILPSVLLLMIMINMFFMGGLSHKTFWYFFAIIVAIQINHCDEPTSKPTQD